jgi:hypothetical protein
MVEPQGIKSQKNQQGLNCNSLGFWLFEFIFIQM